MKEAKKFLMLKVEIGEIVYEFEKDMFDLNQNNLGILNEQICKIPGYVAFVVEAHSEAEKQLAKKETQFEVWVAQRIVKYFSDKEFKAEKDKMNNLIASFTKEYNDFRDDIYELKKLVKVLDAYRKGIDAKLQLAQTLSANTRIERDGISRNYDKHTDAFPF